MYCSILFFSETKPADKGEESVALVVALMTGLYFSITPVFDSKGVHEGSISNFIVT